MTVNCYLRCLNAYFRWLHTERGQPLLHVPKLKEEQKVIAVFSASDITRMLGWKPKGFTKHRMHALVCTLLDTGLRISEALAIRRDGVDLENMLLTVVGKGRKERKVPISLELRKVLYRFLLQHKFDLVFCTKAGTRLTRRNAERDFEVLGKKLAIRGVRFSPHTCRHTFAVNYLRAGGNLYYLSRILGHTSVTTTERYLQAVGTQDLQKVHDRLSLLSR